jgi:hypothetical protein
VLEIGMNKNYAQRVPRLQCAELAHQRIKKHGKIRNDALRVKKNSSSIITTLHQATIIVRQLKTQGLAWATVVVNKVFASVIAGVAANVLAIAPLRMEDV